MRILAWLGVRTEPGNSRGGRRGPAPLPSCMRVRCDESIDRRLYCTPCWYRELFTAQLDHSTISIYPDAALLTSAAHPCSIDANPIRKKKEQPSPAPEAAIDLARREPGGRSGAQPSGRSPSATGSEPPAAASRRSRTALWSNPGPANDNTWVRRGRMPGFRLQGSRGGA